MTEHPILFNGEMVQATLSGRKTQTRRVIKFPKGAFRPDVDWIRSVHQDGGGNWVAWSTDESDLPEFTKQVYPDGEGFRCPYGRPGDRLWVREAWRVGAWDENTGKIAVDYKADGYSREEWLQATEEQFERLWIQSSGDAVSAGLDMEPDGRYCWEPGDAPTRWRSSRFMFKWAARIWLEVVSVRVERAQEISEEDVIAEGCGLTSWGLDQEGRELGPRTAGFAELWDSINAKSGFGWTSNPWVWVISFKRSEVLDG